MLRSRSAACVVLALLLFVVLASTAGCGGHPQGPVVRKFFVASRMGDATTLANLALTAFDARTEGEVVNLSIVSETPEQVVPLQLKALAEAFRAAQEAERQFTDKWDAYRQVNREAIRKVHAAVEKGLTLKGPDAAIQEELSKWEAEGAQLTKNVSEAREAISRERPVVELSMRNPLKPVDATQYDGVLATKEMTVSANMKMPDGQSAKKTLVVTLKQARMKGPQGDIAGNWIVTNVASAPGGARP